MLTATPGYYTGPFPLFAATVAGIRARRIRRAVDRLYRRDPQRAIEHVNAKLADASREEEQRANLRTTI